MLVFIDGENFRQRLTETLIDAGIINNKHARFSINIRKLLEDVLDSRDLTIKYYASVIRLPKNYIPAQDVTDYINKVKEERRYWIRNLKGQNIEYVKAGTLKVRQGAPCRKCHAALETLQEKGVDVRLALDIFESSFDRKNREIAVFSSDVDICPAYHKIQKHGARVNYVCFENYLNRGSSAAANRTIKIPTEKLAEFIKTY